MTTKTICFASAKGGSGKTSLIATFATFLSNLGKKTLLIDSDFATNGLTLLYLKEVRVKSELVYSKSRKPSGLREALLDAVMPDIVPLSDFLDFIPAAFDLQSAISKSDESIRANFISLITAVQENYDYIFVDAQAGSDDMGQIAMSRRVSDEVVIVSEYDPMSAAGVERLKALLRDDLTYDRTWVLLNKILPEFAKSFSDFMEVAKYLSPIPWDSSVVRAYARRRLAIDTEAGNEHTISVLQALKGLCGESIQEDLSTWVQSRAAVIRQPLEEQYEDAEKEVAFLLMNKSTIERRKQILRLVSAFAMTILGVGAGLYVAFRHTQAQPWSWDLVSVSSMAFLALALLSTILKDPDFLLRAFGFQGVQRQVDEIRYDRQLDLLRERLKRLELLRTLEPETLLGRPELRQSEHVVSASRKSSSFH